MARERRSKESCRQDLTPGIALASDGHVYFGGGSHSPERGAAFFRYDTHARKLIILCDDISKVCGEVGVNVPHQAKIHSEIPEHRGWLYFGSHLGDYSETGKPRFLGSHLIGYELATEKLNGFHWPCRMVGPYGEP